MAAINISLRPARKKWYMCDVVAYAAVACFLRVSVAMAVAAQH